MVEEKKYEKENNLPDEEEESSYRHETSSHETKSPSTSSHKKREELSRASKSSPTIIFPEPTFSQRIESESRKESISTHTSSSTEGSSKISSSGEKIKPVPFEVKSDWYIYLKIFNILWESSLNLDSYYSDPFGYTKWIIDKLRSFYFFDRRDLTDIEPAIRNFQDFSEEFDSELSEFVDIRLYYKIKEHRKLNNLPTFDDLAKKFIKFFNEFKNNPGYLEYMREKGWTFRDLFLQASQIIDEKTKKDIEQEAKEAINNELCAVVVSVFKKYPLLPIYRSDNENIKHYLKVNTYDVRYAFERIFGKIAFLESLMSGFEEKNDNVFDPNRLRECISKWEKSLLDKKPENVFKALHLSLIIPSFIQMFDIPDFDVEKYRDMLYVRGSLLDTFEKVLRNKYMLKYEPVIKDSAYCYNCNVIYIGYFVNYKNGVFNQLDYESFTSPIVLVVPKEINKYLNYGDKHTFYIYGKSNTVYEVYKKLSATVKDKNAEVIIPTLDKIKGPPPLYLKDVLFKPKPTTSPTQISPKPQLASAQKTILYEKLKNNPFYGKLQSSLKDSNGNPAFFSLASRQGNIIIVYDENKKGIDESLAKIAVRAAQINGHYFNPKSVSKSSKTDIWYLLQVGINDGIFVLNSDLCPSKTNSVDDIEIMNKLKELLKGVMGTKYSIIIMPKCLYSILQLTIGNKPNHILFEDFDLPTLNTLAYIASGGSNNLIPDWRILSNTNTAFYMLLTNSSDWLSMTYPNLVTYQQNASDLHNKLQDYSVAYLITKKKADSKNILVQYDFGGLIPDVFEISNSEVYDAKASIGELPNQEVWELADKYSNIANKVIAVMDPLAVLLDLKPLISKLDYLNSSQSDVQYDVMVPFSGVVRSEEKEETDSGEKEYNMLSLDELLKLAEDYYNENVKEFTKV